MYKSESSGTSTTNREHLLAELRRIDIKLRLRAMPASFAQFLVMFGSVAITEGIDVYNKRMAAGE